MFSSSNFKRYTKSWLYYSSAWLFQSAQYLFNYANIGMQRPLVQKKEVDLFDKLYFDICRLGAFNANFKLAEPHLRNADILSVDFKSQLPTPQWKHISVFSYQNTKKIYLFPNKDVPIMEFNRNTLALEQRGKTRCM